MNRDREVSNRQVKLGSSAGRTGDIDTAQKDALTSVGGIAAARSYVSIVDTLIAEKILVDVEFNTTKMLRTKYF